MDDANPGFPCETAPVATVSEIFDPSARDRAEVAQLWRQQWRYAMVVGIFSPVSYVLVLYALQVAPLSHVAPAREVSMLFAALLGGHLLGEKDRGLRIAGAALIALGVMALGMG